MKNKRLGKYTPYTSRVFAFSFYWIALIAAALLITRQVPKGGVWNNHMRDGLLYLQGVVPEPPTYPLWGYSILAGLFRENLIYVQAILLGVVGIYWYSTIMSLTGSPTMMLNAPRNAHARLSGVLPELLTVLLLAPFVFLCVSYYSNSMTCILMFLGSWLLYLATNRRNSWPWYCISGLLFGLAANIRSEVLLLAGLLTGALILYGLIRGSATRRAIHALCFLTVIFAATLPWQYYSYRTVGESSMTATNGGGSMYLGLGTLDNNPWDIEDSDIFVQKRSQSLGLGSPWSYESDKYFRKEFIAAVKMHPDSYARRIVSGWTQLLKQGVYYPDFRSIMKTERDRFLVDYVNERWKGRLGLNVNQADLEKYAELGFSAVDIRLKHYTVILAEYSLRIIYGVAFLSLLVLAAYLTVKSRFADFLPCMLLAYVGYAFIVAGLIYTDPRHTTALIPVLVSVCTLIKQSGNPAAELKVHNT